MTTPPCETDPEEFPQAAHHDRIKKQRNAERERFKMFFTFQNRREILA